MNCINKNIRFQLPEQRISLFSSILLSDRAVKAPANALHATIAPQTYVRTLDTPKSSTTHYKLKKHYSRRSGNERAYNLKPNDFAGRESYMEACQERLRIEEAQDNREYHEKYLQNTFIGVENFGERDVL